MRVRTEAKREAILESAAQVFMEMGYERASMAEIADRTVCSKPTLYSYFPSKTELFMGAIIHKLGGQVAAVYNDLPSHAPEEPGPVLTRLGEHHITTIASPEAFAFKSLIVATMTNRDDAERFWELGNKRLVEIIETYLIAATEAGRFNIQNARVAAQHLLALYEAEVNWSGPAGFSPNLSLEMIREAAERAVQVFLAAYGVESEEGRR
jgi:TetR/AcrR family transcriptional repressor of mexJK operon